jgi:hypothetical protein
MLCCISDAGPGYIQKHGAFDRELEVPRRQKIAIPEQVRAIRLTEALERLVQLYDAWGKKDEAAKWRKRKLDEASPQSKKAEAIQGTVTPPAWEDWQPNVSWREPHATARRMASLHSIIRFAVSASSFSTASR